MIPATEKLTQNLEILAGLTASSRQDTTLSFAPAEGLFTVTSGLASGGLFGKLKVKWKSELDGHCLLGTNHFNDQLLSLFRRAAEIDKLQRRVAAMKGLVALQEAYYDNEQIAALGDIIQRIHPYCLDPLRELKYRFERIDPSQALSYTDIDFLQRVWDERVTLFRILSYRYANHAPDVKPHHDLFMHIYEIYQRNPVPVTRNATDIRNNADFYPANKTSQYGKGYQLQGWDEIVPQMLFKFNAQDYRNSFVLYFGVGKHPPIGRVYINCEPRAISKIVKIALDEQNPFKVESIKVATPHGFDSRVDKIVAYMNRACRMDFIKAVLAATGESIIPISVPMTVQVSPGISMGDEPLPIDTGFFHVGSDNPRISDGTDGRPVMTIEELRQTQSFGTLRCQLIASAMTQMHALLSRGSRKPEHQETFEAFQRWVALAFDAHRRELQGT